MCDADELTDTDPDGVITDPLDPDSDDDGIRDGLDLMPAVGQGSDDNFTQCDKESDGSSSTIMKNTMISDVVFCADPDGIVVGEADPPSPVQVTGTGKLITITPDSTEFKGPFKVDANGQVTQFNENIPAPPP